MNFLIFPPLTPDELAQVQALSAELEIVNAMTEEDASGRDTASCRNVRQPHSGPACACR